MKLLWGIGAGLLGILVMIGLYVLFLAVMLLGPLLAVVWLLRRLEVIT